MFGKLKCLAAASLLLICAIISFSQQNPTTAREFYERAEQLLEQNKLEDALSAFRKSAELAPEKPQIRNGIGLTLSLLGRIDESIAVFREVIAAVPNNLDARLEICRVLVIANQPSEAIEHCTLATRIDDSEPEAFAGLIFALKAAKRDREALSIAAQSLRRFKDNFKILTLWAELNFNNGNYTEALQNFLKLAEMDPTDASFQVRLAQLYLRLEQDNDAVAAAKRAIEIKPDLPLAHYFLGKTYFELGMNEEAEESFLKAALADPKSADAQYFLGASQKRLGKIDNAISSMRRSVELDPANVDFLIELGEMLSLESFYEEAIVPLRKAHELDPRNFSVKVTLGVALLEAARYEEALPLLQEANRIKPGEPTVSMFLNVARSRMQGVYQISELKKFAEENPRDVNVRLHLIQKLGFSRRMGEAEIYVEQFLALKPKEPKPYLSIAVVYATAGDHEKAFEIYKKSLEIKPDPGAYFGIATYFARKGQVESAIEAYKKVFELQPDSPNLLLFYANFLRDNGKRREALELYKRTLETLPTNSPALFNAGMLSARLGDLASGKHYLEILRSVDPESAKMLERCLRFRF